MALNFLSSSKGAGTKAPAPLGQSQSAFINNETAGTKKDPATAARTAISDPQATQQNAQAVSTFNSKLDGLNQWSRGITQQQQQSFAQKQAQRAAQGTAVRLQNTRKMGESYSPVSLVDNATLMGYSRGASPARQQIVNTALSYVKAGTMYAWGGGGAGTRVSRGTGKGTQNVIGVDCSGLTSYAYSQIGVKLPHYSGSQTSMGYRTNIKNAQPGDIVGWGKGGHVAIYIGNGQIAEAPGVGKPVRTRALRPGENVYAVRLKLPGE